MITDKIGMIFQVMVACLIFLSMTPVSLSARNSAMDIFSEAVSQISQNSLDQPLPKTVIEESLKAYLKNIDSYSDYLSPKEYKQFRELQNSRYSGVGMEIERDEAGRFICMPHPGEPAERAGVRFGDILVSVDGKTVENLSLFALGGMIRGENNTEILLTVQSENEKPRSITIRRSRMWTKSVVSKKIDGFSVIRILYFNIDTQRNIKEILTGLSKRKPIIIDLRGNLGGDLHSAIDAAMLFLEKEKTIVSAQKSQQTIVYKSTTIPFNMTSPLYICQDGRTASAAEVFIAGLVQNRRAVSIGQRTYGKGVSQNIIELSDGSALFLTTAYLKTPNGQMYHEAGLQPTYPLPENASDFSDYILKIRQIN